MIPHFSTAKSPMMMQGAIAKKYFAQRKGLDPSKICSVVIIPFTAKKFETQRCGDKQSSGYCDVVHVLTARELARLIKTAGIDFANLEVEEADSPTAQKMNLELQEQKECIVIKNFLDNPLCEKAHGYHHPHYSERPMYNL